MLLLFFLVFLVLMIVGVPVAFALLIAPIVDVLVSGDKTFLTLFCVVQKLWKKKPLRICKSMEIQM